MNQMVKKWDLELELVRVVVPVKEYEARLVRLVKALLALVEKSAGLVEDVHGLEAA